LPKPPEDFHRVARNSPKRKTECKECSTARRTKWAEDRKKSHPVEYHEQWRGAVLRKYGITKADYDSMLAASGGCEICGTSTPGSKRFGYFHIDHDHATGRVRGLLCHHCNLGLGNFKDNPELMAKAITYIKRTVLNS
jgi:hypothetical protein